MSDLLDAAVGLYALGKFYEQEGDPELLRRIVGLIEAAGLTVEDVERRLRELRHPREPGVWPT